MAGIGALWRAVAVGEKEADATKIIEFTGGIKIAAKPDALSVFGTIQDNINKQTAEHTAAFSGDIDKPDVGIIGDTLEITILFLNPGTSPAGASLVKQWIHDPDGTPEAMPKGRFGFRYDMMPWLNCIPTAKAGYNVIGLDMSNNMEIRQWIPATIRLQFNGLYSERTPT